MTIPASVASMHAEEWHGQRVAKDSSRLQSWLGLVLESALGMKVKNDCTVISREQQRSSESAEFPHPVASGRAEGQRLRPGILPVFDILTPRPRQLEAGPLSNREQSLVGLVRVHIRQRGRRARRVFGLLGAKGSFHLRPQKLSRQGAGRSVGRRTGRRGTHWLRLHEETCEWEMRKGGGGRGRQKKNVDGRGGDEGRADKEQLGGCDQDS